MKLPLLLVLWALSLTITAAYADTIKTFNYEGFLEAGTTPALTGSVTIDTTTGVVTDASSFLLGNTSYPNTVIPPEVLTYPGETLITFGWETNLAFLEVNLALPVTTLIGFSNSYLCSVERPCPGGDESNITRELRVDFLGSGDISLSPEPSTLVMLATGAFAFAGAARRRFRA